MGMKKKCELCISKLATIYCESDEATLCYECDSNVHGANFLVAKHLRTVLCHACQSPTLRTGSGPRVGPTTTISFCTTCLGSHNARIVHDGDHDDYDDDEDDDDDDDFEEDESHFDDDNESDDEENQVVPWSYSVSHNPW